jgi:hypothetical protein
VTNLEDIIQQWPFVLTPRVQILVFSTPVIHTHHKVSVVCGLFLKTVKVYRVLKAHLRKYAILFLGPTNSLIIMVKQYVTSLQQGHPASITVHASSLVCPNRTLGISSTGSIRVSVTPSVRSGLSDAWCSPPHRHNHHHHPQLTTRVTHRFELHRQRSQRCIKQVYCIVVASRLQRQGVRDDDGGDKNPDDELVTVLEPSMAFARR